MEKTNQTPEVDKDFETIKAKLPFDEADKKPEAPKEPEAPAEPAKPETPKEPVADRKDQKPEDKEPEDKPVATRPERYIPVKKYTDEKNDWKQSDLKKDQKIAELQAIADGKPDTAKNDNLIKAYCEKYNVDEDTARAEIDRVKFVNEFGEQKPASEPKKPDEPAKLTPEQEAKIERADEIEANDLFNKEFNEVAIPSLKQLFPNATPEQLAEAKKELEALATTTPYLDKSLDYVAFKEKDALSDIFSAERKGPEPSRATQKGASALTASDFENGKTSFAELDKLPSADREKIFKGLSIKAWDAYTHYQQQNQEVQVS